MLAWVTVLSMMSGLSVCTWLGATPVVVTGHFMGVLMPLLVVVGMVTAMSLSVMPPPGVDCALRMCWPSTVVPRTSD